MDYNLVDKVQRDTATVTSVKKRNRLDLGAFGKEKVLSSLNIDT